MKKITKEQKLVSLSIHGHQPQLGGTQNFRTIFHILLLSSVTVSYCSHLLNSDSPPHSPAPSQIILLGANYSLILHTEEIPSKFYHCLYNSDCFCTNLLLFPPKTMEDASLLSSIICGAHRFPSLQGLHTLGLFFPSVFLI